MRFVISPVGTSILANQKDSNRKWLSENANNSREDTPQHVIEHIVELERRAHKSLSQLALNEIRRISAELNGIIGIYNEGLPHSSPDMHYLISTDTYQGKIAAGIVQKYLKKNFPNTQIYCVPGLNTKDKLTFETGIKELLEWCDKTLPGYKTQEYSVIFNLTGGFKSLQGYLNTIGMFYADHIVYIFETGHEIINIPRLPIHLETGIFEKYATLFLQLSQADNGLLLQEKGGLPDIMLYNFEGRYLLSNWGTLVWNNAKLSILSRDLLALPYISYENTFKSDFSKNKQSLEKITLQEKIAKVSYLLQENNGDISCLKAGRAGGLLYDNYSGKNKHLGHFRLNDGNRVSCEYRDTLLKLRHFGSHDYVNDNP